MLPYMLMTLISNLRLTKIADSAAYGFDTRDCTSPDSQVAGTPGNEILPGMHEDLINLLEQSS
jgi:hypothetical protein